MSAEAAGAAGRASLAGRVVAVTGASRGIGRAIAERLAQQGAVVLGGARSMPATGVDGVRFMPLDVTDEASVAAFTDAAQALGADALVCNAGVGSFAPLEQATVAEYRRIMDTNVLGTLLVTKGLVAHFRRRHAAGGSSQVVVVTSDVSSRTFAHGGLYTASKHAQRALTRTLAFEGQGYGLRVTEVRPGQTDTAFNGATPGGPDRVHRLQPQDVAEAVRYALAAPAHARIDDIVLHPVAQDVVF